MSEFETILVRQDGRVGWITINRPDALNALNTQVMWDILSAAEAFDADAGVGCIVVTGSERAFAAGADIKEMESKSGLEMLMGDHFGGCELAMMCDIILAADTARFGQPEINLGVMPGMGGSQRLVRAVGYYKAAELILTGRMIDAAEAERIGLVSRVVPADELLTEAGRVAETIASKSLPSLYATKAALDAAMETPLAEGLRFERHVFASLFDTADQKEGMAAFREKREPRFEHR
jgi:enoyl-CoA hydratase